MLFYYFLIDISTLGISIGLWYATHTLKFKSNNYISCEISKDLHLEFRENIQPIARNSDLESSKKLR